MVQADLQIKHQAQTAGGQLVDVGRLDLATAVAEVCIAYVVGHNEDDVGFACPASSLGGGRVRSLQRCATQQNND